MKVREVKQRREYLRNVYDNALKIQECCLRNKEAKGCIEELEEKAQIDTSLRTFATSVASCMADEIRRLENIIDEADVKVN